MKIRKSAEQQNFPVATDLYTEEHISAMLEQGIISDLNKDMRHLAIYDPAYNEPHYVVYASQCKEIKVACFDGYYYNIATLNDTDYVVFVNL